MQRNFRSWALLAGLSLAGCAEGGPPAPAELSQSLPEGCNSIDATPMTEHSCGHAEFGPFVNVAASPIRDFAAASPNVNSVHTHYTVNLPSSASEGTVKYRPQRSGEWVFYVAPTRPITLLDAAGNAVPLVMQQSISSCSLLNHAYVFNLTALATYRLVLGSGGSTRPAVVIEKLDDFQTFYFADADGDGFGNPEDVLVTMCEPPSARVTDDTDCDDGNAAVNLTAEEICDGVDNDCDGQVDEDAAALAYRDADGDGHGDPGQSSNACPAPAGYVALDDDCNDTSAASYPGSEEICDGADNDCDGQTDEDQGSTPTTCGLGACSRTGVRSCVSGEVLDSCTTGTPAANDASCNAVDDDCNGRVDEDFVGTSTTCGVGSCQQSGATSCVGGTIVDSCSAGSSDTEVCDGADNDCDGQIDEGLSLATCGAGSCAATGTSCEPASCTPGAPSPEACNGVDDDCDGQVDDGAGTTYFLDRDGDGFGETGGPSVVGCEPPAGYAAQDGDCYDYDAAIHPGAVDVCFNWLDEDCSGYEDDAPGCEGTCGDGIQEGTEECDDHNTRNGDGCSATCKLECTDIGQAATGHTCGHALYGPFQNATAQPYPGFIYTDVNPTHTHYTVSLPGSSGANESAVLYMPVVTGAFAFYSKGNYPMRLIRTSDQAEVPVRYENAVSTCGEGLTWFRVYDLVVGDDYHVVFGPMEASSAVVVIEYLASFGEFTYYTADRDGDGFGDNDTAFRSWCPMDFPNLTTIGGDCDPEDLTVNPNAVELCDGVDNDCNDYADDIFWAFDDADGDGAGDPYTSAPACELSPGKVDNADDCDDTNPAVHAGAVEVCGNHQDEDCDGEADESCGTSCDDGAPHSFYRDADSDGAGDPTQEVSACTPPTGYVENNGDCDDSDPGVRPGAQELCNDVDDDCDVEFDEGAGATFYRDADGDGFGDAASLLSACTAPDGYTPNTGDCDDLSPLVHPGAFESCDGTDNDCNGLADETGGATYFADADGDGYGDASLSVLSCSLLPGYVTQAGDCNDADPAIHPEAEESCDEADNDCDGEIDNREDPIAHAVEHSCHHAELGPFVGVQPALSDTVPAPNVNAPHTTHVVSLSNSLPGAVTYTPSATGDFAVLLGSDVPFTVEDSNGVEIELEANEPTAGCTFLARLKLVELEAGEHYRFVFGVTATSSTLLIVEAVGEHEHAADDEEEQEAHGTEFFRDADGDGHGTPDGSLVACSAPEGYVTTSDDCDDSNAATYEGAAETCDGRDNDCDGDIDEEGALDPRTFYQDADGDGYGNDSLVEFGCDAPEGFVSAGGDCNDSDPAVHPGAEELCNSQDDDCDGEADSGSLRYYRDRDRDGYGDKKSAIQACEAPPGYSASKGDCDDKNASVHPAAEESCDGKDNDCDGQVDDGGVCKCPPLTVHAMRSFYPSSSWGGTLHLDRPTRIAIPASLAVARGNAGTGEATLQIRKAGKKRDIECRYRAALGGKKYVLKSCSNGLRAGESIDAVRVALRVDSCSRSHGTTQVVAELDNLSCHSRKWDWR